MPTNSYNRVILMGYLIEQNTATIDQTPTTNFTLQLKNTTIPCIVAGKIAETLRHHAKTGQQLLIEGRLQQHRALQKNTVHVDNLQFIGKPPK